MSQAPCPLNPFAPFASSLRALRLREICLTAKHAGVVAGGRVGCSKLLQLALQEREVFLDLLAQVFPVEPHSRVVADNEAPPLVLDDATARLIHTLQAEHGLRRDAA